MTTKRKTTDLTKLFEIENQLEALIDAHGLGYTLESIGIICNGKADHLRNNWQDDASAKVWDDAAIIVSRAAEKISV